MRLVPNSWGSMTAFVGQFFREFNTCHDTQGRFCSSGARHLAAPSKAETRFRVGTKNVYTVPVGKVRRFLYNLRTNEMILGVEAEESQVWNIPFHGEILKRVLGSDASIRAWSEWSRGYIYGDERLGTRIEDIGERGTDTVFEDRIAQITSALVASGAKHSGTIIFATSSQIPDTFGELLDHLGIYSSQSRRRAA